MERKTLKMIILAALAISVLGIGVAFAALSTALNITGTAEVEGPNWSIKFENLGSATVTGLGLGDSTTPPVLTDNSITGVKGIFTGDGTVAYEFDVTNNGALNASIGTLTMLSTPTCTGTGTNAVADQTLVCGGISTSLTYVAGGNAVATGDSLNAGETKRMKFTITYNVSGSHPDNGVDVAGLGATIIYNEV